MILEGISKGVGESDVAGCMNEPLACVGNAGGLAGEWQRANFRVAIHLPTGGWQKLGYCHCVPTPTVSDCCHSFPPLDLCVHDREAKKVLRPRRQPKEGCQRKPGARVLVPAGQCAEKVTCSGVRGDVGGENQL